MAAPTLGDTAAVVCSQPHVLGVREKQTGCFPDPAIFTGCLGTTRVVDVAPQI